MAEYKVKHGNYEDVFVSLDAARRKRDNRWKGDAKIYIKRAGRWELLE